MKYIKKISGFFNTILGYLTFVAFFVIMAFIVLNVIMRFIFKEPILGAYEIVEQMMFVGVFCSFAYAQQKGSHIRVTMLLLHLPKRVSMFLCGLTGIFGVGILAVLSYAVWNQMLIAYSHSYTTSMLKISLVPFYSIEVLCSIFFALAVLVETVEYFWAVFDKKLAEELTATF